MHITMHTFFYIYIFKLASLKIGKSSTRAEVNAIGVAYRSKKGNAAFEFANTSVLSWHWFEDNWVICRKQPEL